MYYIECNKINNYKKYYIYSSSPKKGSWIISSEKFYFKNYDDALFVYNNVDSSSLVNIKIMKELKKVRGKIKNENY